MREPLYPPVALLTAQSPQEAARFMRHAKRTTLTTSDIDQALRVLNIEPLYGHFPHNPPSFRRALPFPQMQNAGSVYFVEDEEIEFDRVLREEKLTMPKGVSWSAHWLAVEGVQPLIPENPPAAPKEVDAEGKQTAASVIPGTLFTLPSICAVRPTWTIRQTDTATTSPRQTDTLPRAQPVLRAAYLFPTPTNIRPIKAHRCTGKPASRCRLVTSTSISCPMG